MLPPGTTILMADGSRKAIEAVRLGDEVLTNRLRPCRVVKLTSRLFIGDMVSLRIHGVESPLILTADGQVAVVSIFSPGYHCAPAERFEAAGMLYVLTGGKLVPALVRSVGKRAVRDVAVYGIGVDEDRHFFAGDGVLVYGG